MVLLQLQAFLPNPIDEDIKAGELAIFFNSSNLIFLYMDIIWQLFLSSAGSIICSYCCIAFQCIKMYHLLAHDTVDGHLGSFQLWSFVNSAAINILEPVFW